MNFFKYDFTIFLLKILIYFSKYMLLAYVFKRQKIAMMKFGKVIY